MKRLALVVLIGLFLGGLVAGSIVMIQAGISAANRHFDSLDGALDP